ncbi:hypothetical protein JZ785_22245 [Alicyclobacillus curvatus]|nr:hypothetical protein JZ785_22245 [Alicyclobacillus curvatus]
MLTNIERERLISQGMQIPEGRQLIGSMQLARPGIATGSATGAATFVATAPTMMDDEYARNLQSEEKSVQHLNLMPDDSEAQLQDCVCTIQLPLLGTGSSRESLSTRTDVAALSRDELMQQGLFMLQTAVGQAYLDLTALLGERVARQQIQTYVLHQVANFMRNSSTS